MTPEQEKSIRRRAHVHKGSFGGEEQSRDTCHGAYETCGEHHVHSNSCGNRPLVCGLREDLDLIAFVNAYDALVAAVSHLKHDPRDTFVRVGAFHGGHDDTRYVTFLPWDAQKVRQGNGEPRPPYAVRIASGG